MKPFKGILEMSPKGDGQLREVMLSLPTKPADPFVHRNMIRDFALREGVLIEANIDNGQHGRMEVKQIVKICGLEPDAWREAMPFEDKVVIDPQPQLVLEPQQKNHEIPYGTTSVRIMDLICPLGFGQRAVIVAPPRTG